LKGKKPEARKWKKDGLKPANTLISPKKKGEREITKTTKKWPDCKPSKLGRLQKAGQKEKKY